MSEEENGEDLAQISIIFSKRNSITGGGPKMPKLSPGAKEAVEYRALRDCISTESASHLHGVMLTGGDTGMRKLA
jgi:hypothetical protein